jgi:ABC-type antimicrobial peptide transport system permease subunit
MNRFKIAQYIALGATVSSVLGFILTEVAGLDFGMILAGIGFAAGLISYIFGGLGTAIKMAGRIATWGWVVVPFPYDIMTFMCSFIIAIIVFVFLPIIPVRKAYKENMYM